MKKLPPIVACLLFTLFSNAQGRYDSAAIEQRFHKIDAFTNILRDFRFKAFVQAEWQKADTAGVNSVQGGNFPAAANNRFLIRWGRLVLQWQHEIVNKHGDTIKVGQFSFNETITERGFGGMYEFYGRIIDPWTGWFGLQGGIWAHQFGFETADFTDVHESPEASRINQNIFPNPSDLGMAIVVESPRTYKPFYLRFDAGVYNGESIAVASETGTYQSRKDFSTRLWMGKFWKVGDGSRIGFNASVSYYNGGVLQTDSAVYEITKNAAGQPVFTNVVAGTPEGGPTGWETHVNEYARDYYGAHAQLNYEYKMRGTATAMTMIRGEYITGTQPGQETSDQIPVGVGTADPGVNLYIRKFDGGTFYFTQTFNYYAGKQLMRTELTFKCDFYNPNTQIKGLDITGASVPPATLVQGHFTSGADMSWNTFSGGIAFMPVPYLKIMLWYDHVVNENTGLTGIYATNYPKDDVFTIRTQFTIDSWFWDKKTINPNQISKGY